MGRNKLLVEIGGRPIVRIVVDNALLSRVSPLVAVTGSHADEVEQTLPPSVTIVRNPEFASGMSSSIRTGVCALPERVDGVLILLGDMPGVSALLIDRMVAAFASGQCICVAASNGVRGNPVLFGREYFPRLQALTGDSGAKSIVTANERNVREIDADDDGPLVDIDTPAALESFIARAQ